jgi:hypothetical protein
MDAHAEQADLAENPLPETPITDPLTRVWTIDGEIAALQEQINALMDQRQQALEYAVRHNITEDARCRLEQKIRETRTLDVARFGEVFPTEYRMACDIERRDLEERMAHIGEKINLTLVDKLVKKPMLEAAQGVVSVKESVSYVVVPK